MDLIYTGSGLIHSHGCPEVEVDYFYSFKYAMGAKVYDKISAKKGVLEAVIVRRAWYVCDPRTGQKKAIYKDEANWLHNEYDLCSQTEAINAITLYYNGKLNDIDRALAELNC